MRNNHSYTWGEYNLNVEIKRLQKELRTIQSQPKG